MKRKVIISLMLIALMAISTTITVANSALDPQALRDYYASQPVVHMSNQSVIYNPDGTIKQVIAGNQTMNVTAANATVTPTVPAMITVTPVPSVTQVPSVPAATRTQAAGFEIVLAAIGMISALVLITRKKK